MRNPLIVAADVSDLIVAEGLAERLSGMVAFVKVGLELFTAHGPEAVRAVRPHAPVFLDLKLHDIPTTVGRASRNAGRLGVSLLTIHALGGVDMMRAAVEGAAKGAADAGVAPPDVLAVTVLSSLGGDNLASPASLAFEAMAAGCAGVVVSGVDVGAVREVLGDEPTLVVPGIRPAGSPNGDQVRVLSPLEALAAGADYLVIGRPITGADDPTAACRAILADVGAA